MNQYAQGFQDALTDVISKIRDEGLADGLEYLLANAKDITGEQRRVIEAQIEATR